MRRFRKIFMIFSLICLFGVALNAITEGISDRIVIQAEKIFTVSHGIIQDGLIVVERGKIVYVGPAKEIPKEAKLIKAKVVIPGLIDTHSHLGSQAGWSEYGGKEFKQGAIPHLHILDHLDLASVDFAFALSGGVTAVMVTPGSGNIIGGQLVVLKTAGDSREKRILRNPANQTKND